MATIEEALDQAISLHQAGQLRHAVSLYQKIIKACQGQHPQALQLMGVALNQLNEHPQAIDALQKALSMDPGSPEAHYTLAISLLTTGQTDTATGHLKSALKHQPDMHQARLKLAVIYEDDGRMDMAIEQYMRLLRIDPNHIPSLNNLAGLLIGQGQLDQALSHLTRVLQVSPDHLPAQCNMAMIHHAKGQTQQAIDQLKSACKSHKTDPQPRYQLALILKQDGQLTDADTVLQQIIALHPKHAAAWTRRGEILQQLNDPGQALMAYDEAIKHSPDNQIAGLKLKRALALPIILHDREQVDLCRQTLTKTIERLVSENAQIQDPLKEVATTPFFLAYHGRDDKPIHESLGKLYRQASATLTWEAPHVSQPRDTSRPIRIAMVSKYLNNHTIGMFMLGIAQHLDPKQFHLSIFHVSPKRDDIANAINAHAASHATLAPDLHAARLQIAGVKPDIVFYPDIGMEPMTYFLAFARLAKVQCAWRGHPVTTGIDTIDYYLSNESLEPTNGDRHYTEKLVRLPTLAMYPSKPQPSAELLPLDHWGIDSGSHLYLCCQSLFKVHPDFDLILKDILEQDASALIVFFQGRHEHWYQTLRNRWKQTVGPMSRRMIFLPRQPFPHFLQLVQHANVILDTLHFTGGNTTFQCMGLNKPIVTLPGQFMKSRITTAVYTQMGLSNLIARSPSEYVAMAVRLASDPDYNNTFTGKIAKNNDVLFANTSAVDELQAFFKQALEQ